MFQFHAQNTENVNASKGISNSKSERIYLDVCDELCWVKCIWLVNIMCMDTKMIFSFTYMVYMDTFSKSLWNSKAFIDSDTANIITMWTCVCMCSCVRVIDNILQCRNRWCWSGAILTKFYSSVHVTISVLEVDIEIKLIPNVHCRCRPLDDNKSFYSL